MDLNLIKYVYIECSYIELYKNQPLFDEIKKYLEDLHFTLVKEVNLTLDSSGKKIQSDFLFTNNKKLNITHND